VSFLRTGRYFKENKSLPRRLEASKGKKKPLMK
jgi:hypothetical protein